MRRRPLLGALDPWALRLRLRAKTILFRLGSVVPGFARLFYALFSTRFTAEQRIVAYGIQRHLAAADPIALHYRLRRHIHRLEKGLSMRMRRPIFGLDYIEQTMRDLQELEITGTVDLENPTQEYLWYFHVLDAYFSACASTDRRFVAAREEHSRLRGIRNSENLTSLRPYAACDRPPLTINFDDYHQLCRRRRSVRWFTPDRVPHVLLDQAIRAANESPSACNRQAVEIRLFENPDEVRRLSSLAPGAAGLYHNFTALAVLIGNLAAYAHEKDRHAIYIDGGMKAMSFMFALETLGLSSCALNWPDDGTLDQKAVTGLGLSATERVVLMIAIGVADPDGLIPYSWKKQT